MPTTCRRRSRAPDFPETESQGRIHTSACTVAVMPEPDEAAEVNINPAELRIDTFRASGAGGQHVNKTDSSTETVADSPVVPTTPMQSVPSAMCQSISARNAA